MDGHLGGVQEFLLDVLSGHEGEPGEDGVVNQLLVTHDVAGIECGDGIHEQVISLFEVPDKQQVQGFINLQSVLPLPIPTFLEKIPALIDDLFHLNEISLLQINGEDLEVDIHLLADLDGLLQGFLKDSDSEGFVGVVLFDERCLGEDGIPDLDVPEVGLGINDLVLKLLELGRVVKLYFHSKYF